MNRKNCLSLSRPAGRSYTVKITRRSLLTRPRGAHRPPAVRARLRCFLLRPAPASNSQYPKVRGLRQVCRLCRQPESAGGPAAANEPLVRRSSTPNGCDPATLKPVRVFSHLTGTPPSLPSHPRREELPGTSGRVLLAVIVSAETGFAHDVGKHRVVPLSHGGQSFRERVRGDLVRMEGPSVPDPTKSSFALT